jgi:E3 ubiquitin-protein ligase DOA10
MILFASFVGWVREVVRPGVLWFFRDPSDPNFNPLKDIVDVHIPSSPSAFRFTSPSTSHWLF